jgi:invasion protein IalB
LASQYKFAFRFPHRFIFYDKNEAGQACDVAQQVNEKNKPQLVLNVEEEEAGSHCQLKMSNPSMKLCHKLTSLPRIQINRLDLGNVSSEGTMMRGALNTNEYPQVVRSPARV